VILFSFFACFFRTIALRLELPGTYRPSERRSAVRVFNGERQKSSNLQSTAKPMYADIVTSIERRHENAVATMATTKC